MPSVPREAEHVHDTPGKLPLCSRKPGGTRIVFLLDNVTRRDFPC